MNDFSHMVIVSPTHSNAGFVPMDKNDKKRRIAANAVAPRKEKPRGKQWQRPTFGKRDSYE